MAYKVLVVDDSGFFQRRLKEIINEHPDLEVIDVAINGREAVNKAISLNPDIISMDYEMPVLNGISAIREIMAHRPVPILMFSSMTYEGAKITLDALEAGAVDFIPKDFAEVSQNSAELKRKIHQRLLDIVRTHRVRAFSPTVDKPSAKTKSEAKPEPTIETAKLVAERSSSVRPDTQYKKYELLAIGASTGGPVAITQILSQLPKNFPVPIIIIQHMPATFTQAFAERLNRICNIDVKQAEDKDSLRPGLALLAPGSMQMMIDASNKLRVKVIPGDERVTYQPSIDITFGSAAKTYGASALAIILTGMGNDGCDGARLLKSQGGTVWSQDEGSSVIFGMPMAVQKQKLSDKIVSLSNIPDQILRAFPVRQLRAAGS
ncbi:chemotaxis response regulator protein-glutamate methylesterase [Aurantivibrio infirmus]